MAAAPSQEKSASDARADLHLVYRLGQQSAEHHDNLAWAATAVMWALEFALLGAAVAFSHDSRVVLGACVLGLALLFAIGKCVLGWRALKKLKYETCQAIEKELDLDDAHRQHDLVAQRWPQGQGMTGAFWVVSGHVFVAWVVLTVLVLAG